MKNIQAQYRDLLEGTMSKANFMRNLRMQFPQYISPVTSFDDSVKILKGKRILSESRVEELKPSTRDSAYNQAQSRAQNAYQQDDTLDPLSKQNLSRKKAIFSSHIDPEVVKKVQAIMRGTGDREVEVKLTKYRSESNNPIIELTVYDDKRGVKAVFEISKDTYRVKSGDVTPIIGRSVSRVIKYIQDNELRDPVIKKDDKKDGETINEAKKPEGVYGHNPNAENDKWRGIDHLNYYQVHKGIHYELSKMPEITNENYLKARKKAVETIQKNPDAYKDLQLANFKEIKKRDEALEMKEVGKGDFVDKANGMKTVKKDAPASANTVSKDKKKKEKITQMTQTPKGKLEAFETPGKEKVLKALKESILEDLMSFNENYEDIGKGSRVKKKDTKEYDASKVGNVEDFDGDTVTVKWDNDSVEHVQKNVLTKKQIPQHPEAAEKFSQIPDSPLNSPLMQYVRKEGAGDDLDSIAQEEFGMDYDQLGPNEKEWCRDELDNRGGRNESSLLEKIKQKLVKAIDKIKKEGAIAQTDTGLTVDAGQNTNQVTQTARNMEKKLGQQLTVTDTKTGQKRNV